MNRRNFNRLGVLSAALGLAPITVAEDFDYPWKLGVITDEVDLDLARVLSSFYPKYQLRWAEIRNMKLDGKTSYVYKDASAHQLRQIRKQLDDAGVKVSVLDTAVYKIAFPGTQPVGENAADLHAGSGEYSQQMEDLKRAAEAAHTLGTPYVRIFTFKRIADPDSIFDRIVQDLYEAIAVAKQQDVILLIENEFDCNVATGTETAKLFKKIEDRTLMHNWDPGNCYEAGEQPFPKAWNQLDHTRISHLFDAGRGFRAQQRYQFGAAGERVPPAVERRHLEHARPSVEIVKRREQPAHLRQPRRRHVVDRHDDLPA